MDKEGLLKMKLNRNFKTIGSKVLALAVAVSIAGASSQAFARAAVVTDAVVEQTIAGLTLLKGAAAGEGAIAQATAKLGLSDLVASGALTTTDRAAIQAALSADAATANLLARALTAASTKYGTFTGARQKAAYVKALAGMKDLSAVVADAGSMIQVVQAPKVVAKKAGSEQNGVLRGLNYLRGLALAKAQHFNLPKAEIDSLNAAVDSMIASAQQGKDVASVFGADMPKCFKEFVTLAGNLKLIHAVQAVNGAQSARDAFAAILRDLRAKDYQQVSEEAFKDALCVSRGGGLVDTQAGSLERLRNGNVSCWAIDDATGFCSGASGAKTAAR